MSTKASITFRTQNGLTQEVAQKFWEYGNHFGYAGAARTYKFDVVFAITDIHDAVEDIQLLASKALYEFNIYGYELLSISVEVIEEKVDE
jgi:hypothetical protein